MYSYSFKCERILNFTKGVMYALPPSYIVEEIEPFLPAEYPIHRAGGHRGEVGRSYPKV